MLAASWAQHLLQLQTLVLVVQPAAQGVAPQPGGWGLTHEGAARLQAMPALKTLRLSGCVQGEGT